MEFDATVEIARPASEVFARLADAQEMAVYRGSPVIAMEKVPSGETRAGTRWREIIRLGPGLRMTILSEVSEYDPPVTLGIRFTGGSMRGELTYTVQTAGEGSVLRQEESLEPVGWLEPFGWLVERMLRPRLIARLLDLKRVMEAGGVRSF
ncbi:MAG: SRPBCC family protein [Acidimicrobiia bacterium]|nr:SRPBCC family protein [Acidimicrobiia bacterium]